MKKIWVYQRLFTLNDGEGKVLASTGFTKEAPWLHIKPDDSIDGVGWRWLCPEPKLVLMEVN